MPLLIFANISRAETMELYDSDWYHLIVCVMLCQCLLNDLGSHETFESLNFVGFLDKFCLNGQTVRAGF